MFSISSDSSDTDSFSTKMWYLTRRKNQERPNHGYFHQLYHQLKNYPEKFFSHLRMSQQTFNYILNILEPEIVKQFKIQPNTVNPISVEERLVLTLRFLATGNSYASPAGEFRLGITTVSQIVKKILPVLWQVLQPLHMKPPTAEEFENIADMFYKNWGFPNCLGSIDGKHIRILCPKWSGSMFFNYKSYFSIVLQAVSDADCKFTFFEVGAYGKQSDGGTFRKSALYDRMISGTLNIPEDIFLPSSEIKAPFVFIGDEAYPLLKHLMKPYAMKNIDESKEKFNKSLSRARKTVECAFGIAAAKWRILHKSIETSVETAELIVKAVCILHNVIMDKESKFNILDYEDTLPGTPMSRRNNPAPTEAIEVRNLYRDFLNQ